MIFVHNRPHDNDCYDDFVEWFGGTMVRWDEYDGTLPAVCCLQDPIGTCKQRAVAGTLNSGMNAARRDHAYPVWRSLGIRCPEDRTLDDLPILVKDVTRQMGKGFVVDSERRLDWLLTECSTFIRHSARFRAYEYLDVRNSQGYHELHRYVVCGDRAIPGVYAKTTGWSCKASHMARMVRKWSRHERHQYADELQAFWASRAPDLAVRAVRSLGLDFALVDMTGDIVWEVNPCMNLRPAEVAGKRERWWPFFANFLDGGDREIEFVDAWKQVELLLNWRGYKPCWISSR